MNQMRTEQLIDLIKYSLWGEGKTVADWDTYEEMKQQAIAVLPAACLSSLKLLPELEKEWKRFIIQQITFYSQSFCEQSNLPLTVPYVVLKGTSAAKYYPHPEYRMMGDIDLMTRREDFDTACKELENSGYCLVNKIYKEASLKKGRICIDLHQQFASLNNPDHVKILDDLIIENINSSHVLPDLINGLTLLDHINQHLEGGLGLRQIIDWMMFVDKCLPDEEWPEFFEMAKRIELVKLAVVCTRMCEMYLGLPHREWCSGADANLCEQLMNYILSCGNFGSKKINDVSSISEGVFAFASTPKMIFKVLHRRGKTNWNAAQKHIFLRPFAGVYQFFRYVSRGLNRDNATSKIREEYAAARKRNAMFDALGVKTAAKGIVMYKDGKYVKE